MEPQHLWISQMQPKDSVCSYFLPTEIISLFATENLLLEAIKIFGGGLIPHQHSNGESQV